MKRAEADRKKAAAEVRKQRDEGAKAAHEQTVADMRDKRQRVAEMTPSINNAATTRVRPC